VAVTQTALPRFTATLRRCMRNTKERCSAVVLARYYFCVIVTREHENISTTVVGQVRKTKTTETETNDMKRHRGEKNDAKAAVT